MEANEKHGIWRDWHDLTPQEREEVMEGLTMADQIHDYYKTHEKPLPVKQQLLHYEQERRIC